MKNHDWKTQSHTRTEQSTRREGREAFGGFEASMSVEGGDTSPYFHVHARPSMDGVLFGNGVSPWNFNGPYPEGNLEIGRRRAEVALMLWRALTCLEAGVADPKSPGGVVLTTAAHLCGYELGALALQAPGDHDDARA